MSYEYKQGLIMKRQLIYHTHVDTNHSEKIQVRVKANDINAKCNLDRVSRDGLTLSCDASTLHLLIPNKSSVAPKDPISLNTKFFLSYDIEADCRVIFARRLSKNEFIMELKFVDISEHDMTHLNEFIERSLSSHLSKAVLNKPTDLISNDNKFDSVRAFNDSAFRKVA